MKQAYQHLEDELGKWIGGYEDRVVACSSGTAALHLALEALHLPRRSLVVIPDFTMVAVARAVTMADLIPYFVDCRREDLNLDTGKLPGAKIARKVSAVIAVHTYGRRCDMEKIHYWAKFWQPMAVIEDMAELHGEKPDPRTDAACWSFYQNKIVGGEEGGAVVLKEKRGAELARSLRCLGFTPAHDFKHVPRGHNYRLANCLAERIRDSLEEFSSKVFRRREVEALYDAECPSCWKQPGRDSPWVYDFRIPGLSGAERYSIVTRLNELGIPARHGFQPMSSQAEYEFKEGGEIDETDNPEAYAAAREVLYVPLDRRYPGVFETIRRLVG